MSDPGFDIIRDLDVIDRLGELEANGAEPSSLPLEEVAAFLRRFVVCSDAQATTVALWVAHTWVFEAFDATPYLAVTSPEKRSGKSRLFDVVELLIARPWRAVQPTEAVTFRKIERDRPTLLLDEVDAIFGNGKGAVIHEGLRALLNAGNRRGTRVPRCVGQSNALQEFEVFCPKALAGIGMLPDTVADRSLPIRLKRKAPGEKTERFRAREAGPQAADLRDALARWGVAAVDVLAEARPALPDELNDRAQDAWEPLLAIADLAGGEWPARARAVAVELASGTPPESDSVGVRLLADVQAVFDEHDDDRLFSADLAAALAEIEESPWGELHGKPLTATALARLLARYDLRPSTIRIGEKTAKGYKREAFEDLFARYLPSEPSHPSQPFSHADLSPVSEPSQDPGVTDGKTASIPHEYSDVTAVTDENPKPSSSGDERAPPRCRRSRRTTTRPGELGSGGNTGGSAAARRARTLPAV